MHNFPSTASAAQIEANRRNAKHGRGPTSTRGKEHSSRNALRHGLAGRIVVLPTEDMEAYKAFSKELVDSLDPQTPMERQLAQTVADSQWRINRARTFEDGMLALGSFDSAGDFNAESPEIRSALTAARVFQERSKDFVNLSLYEQRIQRAQKNAYDQLRELQAERKAATASTDKRLSGASLTAGAGQTTSMPANASEDIGFVCSTPEAAPERRGKTLREEAFRVIRAAQTPAVSTEFPTRQAA